MSLSAIAAWASGSRPYHLYLFQRGTAQYQFASTAEPITKTISGADSSTWTPLAISHDRITDSDQAARSEMKLTAPLSSQIAQDAVGNLGFDPLSIRIYRGDSNTEEVVSLFKGRVLSANPQDDGLCLFSCMTEMAALQRKGLAAVIQRPCRHVHYGRGCNLVLSEWQVELPVASISASGRTVTITGANAQPNGYYQLGTIEWGGRFEMMLTHSGNVVSLVNAIPGLAAAVAAGTTNVKIAPGCPLSRAVCDGRFGNIANFGGFPFISDNIFDGRQLF
jgi:uncharacterized phage protein (TIGR02218 family)